MMCCTWEPKSMSRAIPLPDAGDRAKAVLVVGNLVIYCEALGGRPGIGRVQRAGCQAAPGHSALGVLPLPFDHSPAPVQVFGPLRGAVPPPLACRVGVVATGGSGTLASLVGVAKALEDSGTKVSVYSVCSGSALFGFPLGTGMPPEEVAELTASVRPSDYIDIGWREIATLVPALARGNVAAWSWRSWWCTSWPACPASSSSCTGWRPGHAGAGSRHDHLRRLCRCPADERRRAQGQQRSGVADGATADQLTAGAPRGASLKRSRLRRAADRLGGWWPGSDGPDGGDLRRWEGWPAALHRAPAQQKREERDREPGEAVGRPPYRCCAGRRW
jgi:hypothetical protein